MRTYYLAPVGIDATLTSVSLGMVRALERIGIKTGFVKPVAETFLGKDSDRSRVFAKILFNTDVAESLSTDLVEKRVGSGETEQLMEEVVTLFQKAASNNDAVIVEGLAQTPNRPALAALNVDIARNLSADVILVVATDQLTDAESIAEQIEIAVHQFGGVEKTNFAGYILSKVAPDTDVTALQKEISKLSKTISLGKLPSLGVIPYDKIHEAPRMSDIVNQLKCRVLSDGSGTLNTARVTDYIVVSRTVEYVADLLRPGVLVVTAGDRDDILMATSLAVLRGVPLAGLLLTSDFEPKESIRNLCASALQKIPVLISKHRTFDTIRELSTMDPHIPIDDSERITKLVDYVAEHLNVDMLKARIGELREKRMPPAAFRYQLIQTARSAGKKIVLPEGDEPRTIQAAVICQEKGIAQCILLGKKDKIHEIASAQGVKIPAGLEIIDPDLVRNKYIDPLVEMRKSKGLTPEQAEDQLNDTVVLGTMMIALNEVDGLVSGAVHTTANTIRPALQLIKTAPGSKLVSSVFFMLMPDQVYVYGDCAVNPNPSAEELADIAIQSADSAKAFGVADPRVAMISYSTGSSGTGEDVEKVKQATELVKTKRPDITVDGPLQYDAATVESVGRQKSPGSPVAGQANVFIFPDLNTGNTTYKAVQRSANVVSVGPMLQGLRKPVNDLSRGALVDDIVYTIALTAIQATQA